MFEIGYNLVIFGVLLLLRKRFRPDGSLFAIYLTLYSAWRLGIDFIRDGTDFLFGLHEAQVIAIIVIIICAVWMALKTRRVKSGEEIES
jgi:prolipoprotein diacylglyceryltransferase